MMFGNPLGFSVSISNATIPVAGNVNANITNASVPITGAVNATITSGTVSISGTPTVNIAAGQSVSISNNVTVTPSGTINVQGVPGGTAIGIAGSVTIASGSVSISGTPTVNIAAGQSVSVTSGTVSISGTPTVNIAAGQSVSVTNNVTVTPSGTINVQGVAGGTAIGVAGSVTISSGTVAISGTPTVNIAAGQSVSISGTPSVSISGTPAVTISAGTVNVGSVGSITATVSTALAPAGNLFNSVVTAGATTNVVIPANTRTLLIEVFVGGGNHATNLSVIGHTTGMQYYNKAPYLRRVAGSVLVNFVIIPVLGILDLSVDIVVSVSGGTTATLNVNSDNVEYREDQFYNGKMQSSSSSLSVAGNSTIITGPARILAVSLESNTSGFISLQYNSTVAGTGMMLFSDTGPTEQSLSLPADTILDLNESLFLVQAAAGLSRASAIWAYP